MVTCVLERRASVRRVAGALGPREHPPSNLLRVPRSQHCLSLEPSPGGAQSARACSCAKPRMRSAGSSSVRPHPIGFMEARRASRCERAQADVLTCARAPCRITIARRRLRRNRTLPGHVPPPRSARRGTGGARRSPRSERPRSRPRRQHRAYSTRAGRSMSCSAPWRPHASRSSRHRNVMTLGGSRQASDQGPQTSPCCRSMDRRRSQTPMQSGAPEPSHSGLDGPRGRAGTAYQRCAA